MRILIVKLSSIGDIVHALPTLGAIKRRLPEAEISWVAERRAAEILHDNPLLDRLIEVDTRALRRGSTFREMLPAMRKQLSQLRASSFDVALDLQGLLKSAAIAHLSGAARRYGFDRQALREPASRLLLTDTVKVSRRAHVIYKNLQLAASAVGLPLPMEPEEFEFPINITPEHEREANAIGAGYSYAILNPGGGWPTKQWSPEAFGQLADKLWHTFNLRSIVTYGPGEAALAEQVMRASQTGAASAASLSLKGFYALARKAEVYIGGDTGPTHLAVAARAPIVGLFGPTEWWRNGSPRSEDIVVERTDIGCRVNCHRRACGQWICMNIDAETVFQAVSRRLQRAHAELNTGKRKGAARTYA